MDRFLVTGGAGFIGSHLVHALTGRGNRVRVLDDLSSGSLQNLEPLQVGPEGSGAQVEFTKASICDLDACRQAMRGVAGVFHEAAQVSVPRSIDDPLESYHVNVTGTLHLLEAAKAAGVRRFVFAASSAAYGDSAVLPKVETMLPAPLSPYASGKIAGEHLLRVYAAAFGMQTVCLRYFNVFGPRQADDSPYTGVIAIFARALLEGRAATIFGDGGQTRDFTFVGNVVDANLLAMEASIGEPGSVINIGAGERLSINELYDAMANQLGVGLRPKYMPARAGDVRDSLASLEKAQKVLGYRPRISWREGLRDTVSWYQARWGRC